MVHIEYGNKFLPVQNDVGDTKFVIDEIAIFVRVLKVYV